MYTLFTQICWGQRKKKGETPPGINYNNPTSRETERGRKKIYNEIKEQKLDVIMCQKIKQQLPYQPKWARCAKHAVVDL